MVASGFCTIVWLYSITVCLITLAPIRVVGARFQISLQDSYNSFRSLIDMSTMFGIDSDIYIHATTSSNKENYYGKITGVRFY